MKAYDPSGHANGDGGGRVLMDDADGVRSVKVLVHGRQLAMLVVVKMTMTTMTMAAFPAEVVAAVEADVS